MMLRFALCCILFWFSPHASAWYYKQYTTSSRLPSDNVYSVTRDSKGFLWFATDKGVCKYDGKQFKPFSILDGIEDNEVFTLFEDKKGRLWLSTLNGKVCYLQNDSVFNSGNSSLAKSLPSISWLNAVKIINDSVMYFGYSWKGVLKLTRKNKTWLADTSSYNEKLSILEYKNGNLYVYNNNSTIAINDKDSIISISTHPRRDVYIANEMLLITDAQGVSVYKDDKLMYTHRSIECSVNNVASLYADTSGNIFCCTNNGLHIVNYRTGKKDKIFINTKVSSIAQDVAGNYWIGTMGSGVFCLQKEFERLKPIYGTNDAKVSYNIHRQLFVSGNDNVYCLMPGDHDMVKLPFKCNMKYDPVYLDSNIFVYGFRDSTVIVNVKSGKSSRHWMVAKNVHRYRNDAYLFHGAYELHHIKANGYEHRVTDTFALPGPDRIMKCVYDATRKRAYLLASNCLYDYRPDTKQCSRVAIFPSSSVIVNIFPIRSHLLFFSNDQKFFTYDGSTLSRKKRLGYRYAIFDIHALDNDNYLLQTNKGHFLYKASSIAWRLPEKIEYPFASEDINMLYPVDRQIVAKIQDKLYLFNANILNNVLTAPRILVEKLFADNKEYSGDSVRLFNTSESNIRIVLGGVYFNNSQQTYRYHISRNGTGTGSWLNSDGRFLNIMLQKSGDYRIYLKAVSESGAHSRVKSIYISLVPPFYYKTWFFISLAAVVVSLMFYGAHLFHSRRRKHLRNELDHMQLEQKALNSLLNPHFIFNTISNIQNLVTNNNSDAANDYLVKLSRLIRQNIDNLQFNLIPLANELALIQNYIHLQNLRFNNSIIYEVTNNIGNIETVNIPPLMLHTIVENCVVHGYRNDGTPLHITVDLSLTTGDYLLMEVVDDGNGYHPSATHIRGKSSMGLSATQTRLSRLSAYHNVKYSIDIHNRSDGRGTEVIIVMYAKFIAVPMPVEVD